MLFLGVFVIVQPSSNLLLFDIHEQLFAGRYYPSYIGAVYAQIALVAFWFVFSTNAWYLRWPASIALLALTYLLTATRHLPNNFYHYTPGDEVLYGSTLLVLLPFCVVVRLSLGPVTQT